MHKTIRLMGASLLLVGVAGLSACGGGETSETEVTIRNLYFENYEGGDPFVKQLEEKFGLTFKTISSYDWDQWGSQATKSVLGDTAEDVFHVNIDSYNFANLYKSWAKKEYIKPLPTDLSKWPNIEKLIKNTSSVDYLKIDDKMYGIPIAKNTTDFSTSFSPFTYIYRRDWAKRLGVYQENDEYTWAQFEALLSAFKTDVAGKQDYAAMGDIEWGYPSVINFYKQVPHCFAKGADGKYVNNYTTDDYLKGLEKAKEFQTTNEWYHSGHNYVPKGEMTTKYTYNKLGVLYENLSYSNYVKIRQKLKEANASRPEFNLDDATAIMKVRGEDGKYVLEGTDNWFSMTFFNYKVSDEKQEKILNMMDWLLSEEGTIFAIYGLEGFYYTMVDGKPQIIKENWDDGTGKLVGPINGAKYFRYTVSLGYDTLEYDPVTDEETNKILINWEKEMKEAEAKGELKVLKEEDEVRWADAPLKNTDVALMREQALKDVMDYSYGKTDITGYKNCFGDNWITLLSQVNEVLNK